MRPRRFGVVAATTLALMVSVAAPAAADPDSTPSEAEIAASREAGSAAAAKVGRANAQLALADAELDRLAVDVAQAVESYNAAVYRLEQARAAAAEAEARSAEARAELGAARDEVGRFAAAAYRSGGDFAGVSALLSASGPQSLVDRSSGLEAVARHQDRVLRTVEVSEVVGRILSEQAADALAAAATAQAEVAQRKAAAEAQVAAQQQLVAGIQVSRDAATEQLEQTTATTAALERQRQSALAREAADRRAAERRAQEAAARARQQRSSPPPSVGSDAGVVGGNGSRPAPAPVWSPPLTGGSSRGTVAGAEEAIRFARAQIGKPYQWAAAGPDTFDCSGLTMRAWQAGGVSLPHWSVAQFAQGQKVPLSDARPGDLVFFGSDPTDAGSIYHVGLYIGDGEMIEAPYTGAFVRISSINRASFFGLARP